MKLNIKNILMILLIQASVLCVNITDTCIAQECEYRYYYVSLDYYKGDADIGIRVMEMWVSDAYIYDLPKLPSSWVYNITTNAGDPERIVSYMSAAAKSDNHTIKYKDLENFLIIRQHKSRAEKEKITMSLIILYINEKGTTSRETVEPYDNGFTVKRIDKCLPEKPQRH
ncbi:MAG: hypothetical protein H7843_16180 [Nitrospirota bacterium]